MGHSRHFDLATMTSGLPPETDIVRAGQDVSNVRKPEVATPTLFPVLQNHVADLLTPKCPNQGDEARKRVLAVQLLIKSILQGIQVA